MHVHVLSVGQQSFADHFTPVKTTSTNGRSLVDIAKQHVSSNVMKASQSLQTAISDTPSLYNLAASGSVQHSLSTPAAQHSAKGSGSMQSSLSALAAQHSAKESGSMQPSLSTLAAQHSTKGSGSMQSSLAAQHSAKERGSTKPSLSALAAQYSAKESGSMQPSLSTLAAQHSAKGSGSMQSSLSALASQHSAKESGSMQPSLSTLAAQHSTKGSGLMQSSLAAQHSAKERGSTKPSLSALAAQHSAKESGSMQPSLSTLAAQHSAKGSGSMQSSLSALASQHSAKESGSMQSSLSTLAAQHSTKGSGSMQSSLSALAAQHSAKESGSTKPSLSALTAQHSAKESGSTKPNLSTLPTQHSTQPVPPLKLHSFSSSSHPPPTAESNLFQLGPKCASSSLYSTSRSLTSGDNILSSLSKSCSSSSSLGYASKDERTQLSDLVREHGGSENAKDDSVVKVNCANSSLSQLVESYTNAAPSNLQATEQQPLLRLSDFAKASTLQTQHDIQLHVHADKPLQPPPGFKGLPLTVKSPTVSADTFSSFSPAMFLHSSHTSRNAQALHSSSSFKLTAQPSLFSVTLCRDYSLDHASRQYTLTAKAHSHVIEELVCAFDSLAEFNFLNLSPDDIVREKQTEGFNRKYT